MTLKELNEKKEELRKKLENAKPEELAEIRKEIEELKDIEVEEEKPDEIDERNLLKGAIEDLEKRNIKPSNVKIIEKPNKEERKVEEEKIIEERAKDLKEGKAVKIAFDSAEQRSVSVSGGTILVPKNGKKVYPEELEYCLADSPYISECLVLGRTNEQNNETYVNAQIFPDFDLLKKDKGITSTEDIKEFISEIIKNINSKLPNYKHIKEFTIKDTEFEKTTTQKIKRFGKNIK